MTIINTEYKYNSAHLAYGKTGYDLDIPKKFDVIEPEFMEEISDPTNSINEALINPINSQPLRQLLEGKKDIAISVCDITRAQPRKIVIETIVNHIKDIIPISKIKILIATGTHRENTKEELIDMLGKNIVDSFNKLRSMLMENKLGKFDELGKASSK